MSEEDRQRWDARYAAGAYAERTQPSAYVRHTWEAIRQSLPSSPQACDVACGAGRNAIFLAQVGCSVDGLDVSGVALQRAQVRAESLDLDIAWRCCDLLAPDVRLPRDDYDLIVVVRFVANALIPTLCAALAPGGFLMIEEHLRWHEDVELAGPGSDRFRVVPGSLGSMLEAADTPMAIREQFEGLIDEVDGSQAAVARVLAQRVKDS